MKIIIDTLSISFKYDAVILLRDMLNLSDVSFQELRARNYDHGLYFDGIVIAYNTDPFGLITDTFLDLSGRGCRTVEQLSNKQFDWYGFLYTFDSQIRTRQVHISRIDIAADLDDTDIEIPFDRFYKYSFHEMYVCKSKLLPKIVIKRQETIYFGSEKSDRLLRIYNKALQMNLPDTYWIRLEFQLRNDNATSFYLNWVEHHKEGIGYLYRGIMLDYLRFVDGDPDKVKESKALKHQKRLPTAKWWAQLLDDAVKIPQLYLPGEDYTLEKLDKYAEKNIASTLKTYSIAHDGDLTYLINAVKHCKLNVRQRALLDGLEKFKTPKKEELEVDGFEFLD